MLLDFLLLLKSTHQLVWLSYESVDHVHGCQPYQPIIMAVLRVDLLKVADKALPKGRGGEIRRIQEGENGLHLLPDREPCLGSW